MFVIQIYAVHYYDINYSRYSRLIVLFIGFLLFIRYL